MRRGFLTCDAGTRKPREARRTTAFLKSESRLITHGDTIEHVVGWDCGSVSLGAFIKIAKRLRPQNRGGSRSRKRQFLFRIDRQ